MKHYSDFSIYQRLAALRRSTPAVSVVTAGGSKPPRSQVRIQTSTPMATPLGRDLVKQRLRNFWTGCQTQNGLNFEAVDGDG